MTENLFEAVFHENNTVTLNTDDFKVLVGTFNKMVDDRKEMIKFIKYISELPFPTPKEMALELLEKVK